MRLSSLKKEIVAIEKNYGDDDYDKFKKKLNSKLKALGFKRFSAGKYSDVYGSKQCKYVVKVIQDGNISTYGSKYSNLYLKPKYISKNLCVAIQEKVEILSDVLDRLSEKYSDCHDSNIGIYKGKLVIIDLDKMFENKC